MKIVKSPYLYEKSSDVDEIKYTNADLELGDSQLTTERIQFLVLPMQFGLRRYTCYFTDSNYVTQHCKYSLHYEIAFAE